MLWLLAARKKKLLLLLQHLLLKLQLQLQPLLQLLTLLLLPLPLLRLLPSLLTLLLPLRLLHRPLLRLLHRLPSNQLGLNEKAGPRAGFFASAFSRKTGVSADEKKPAGAGFFDAARAYLSSSPRTLRILAAVGEASALPSLFCTVTWLAVPAGVALTRMR